MADAPSCWDPLSWNPYRILGMTRDEGIPDVPGSVFQCPGLAPLESTAEHLEQARASLQSPQQPFYYATWFDASRSLDRAAYCDVLQGALQEAWQRWSSDPHPLSWHNLAILQQLRWQGSPHDLELARQSLARWKQLYEQHGTESYASVLQDFRRWVAGEADAGLQRGQAAAIRRLWQLALVLLSPEEVELEQRRLFEVEIQRLEVELAGLRSSILECGNLGEVESRFEASSLTTARMIAESCLPGCLLVADLDRQLALFERLLARSWLQLSRVERAQAWLESALHLAPEDLKGEIRPELEHLRINSRPAVARMVAAPQVPTARGEWLSRLLGLLILLLAVAGLAWSIREPVPDSLGGMNRVAARRRVHAVLQEISPLAQRLARLREQIAAAPPEQRKRLEAEQARLRKRHQELKTELVRLQRWLDRP